MRKILITAGAYESEQADEILERYRDGMPVGKIAEELRMSISSVNSYLPYTKVIYKAEEISATAERIRKYRERKAAVELLSEHISMVQLWKAITLFDGYRFQMSSGLNFTYTVRGRELFFNRKENSITYATVEMALRKVLELDGLVEGPKKIGTFGASYLYPMFIRFGLINET